MYSIGMFWNKYLHLLTHEYQVTQIHCNEINLKRGLYSQSFCQTARQKEFNTYSIVANKHYKISYCFMVHHWIINGYTAMYYTPSRSLPHSWFYYNIKRFTHEFRWAICASIVYRKGWYGTPCNIYSDDRILKSVYNYGFKMLKIYNICPKNTFKKFELKEIKSKTGTRDPWIADLSFDWLS